MGDYDYNYNYRSKSSAYNHDMQIQAYSGGGGPPPPPPMRSYSTSYAQTQVGFPNSDFSLEKTKGKIGSSSVKNWGFTDPEFQRKKRVASYKVYAVEGRVKGSFRNSFRWLKDRYTKVVYGWW